MKKGLLILIPLAILLFPIFYKYELLSNPMQNAQRKTIQDRLDQYGAVARKRWKPFFEQANVTYPAKGLIFVGIKNERILQVYGMNDQGQPRFIRNLPVRGASGMLGPKLREGDLQVPEGLYEIESLNPNSRFHLSLRVNYPNTFDRAQAAKEGRTNLGGDIMIHGGSASIGCLAMGDEAAEDLFVLAADCGIKNIKVILTPIDFRKKVQAPNEERDWVKALYSQITVELKALPALGK